MCLIAHVKTRQRCQKSYLEIGTSSMCHVSRWHRRQERSCLGARTGRWTSNETLVSSQKVKVENRAVATYLRLCPVAPLFQRYAALTSLPVCDSVLLALGHPLGMWCGVVYCTCRLIACRLDLLARMTCVRRFHYGQSKTAFGLEVDARLRSCEKLS